MGSGNGSNFEAIAKYFEKRSDIEITCLSNSKMLIFLKEQRI